VKGGREGRPVDARTLATVVEKLGAGEILLTKMVKEAVTIPVIASSGAGKVEHFSEVFEATDADAALAAGIFHREEVPIAAVKEHLRKKGIEVR